MDGKGKPIVSLKVVRYRNGHGAYIKAFVKLPLTAEMVKELEHDVAIALSTQVVRIIKGEIK